MKRFAQAVLGLVVSGLALWLMLRGKDFHAVWSAIQGADYAWLAPYFLVMGLIHVVQTWRWGLLLAPLARIPFWRLNAVSAVGFMATVLLPFRLGELARPYLVAERPRLPATAALSTVVVERVVDGLFMAALLSITLLGVPDGSGGLTVLRLGGAVVFIAFAALVAMLVVTHRNRAFALRLAHRILDPVSSRLASRAIGMMDAFFSGLGALPSRGAAFLFFVLTAIYWALGAASIAVLARGFDIRLSAFESLTVLCVLVVGIMIPAGPGMVGTYQAAVLVGLSFFLPRGVVDSRGIAFANVLWAGQIAAVTAIGTIFLFSRHVRLERALEPSAGNEGGA